MSGGRLSSRRSRTTLPILWLLMGLRFMGVSPDKEGKDSLQTAWLYLRRLCRHPLSGLHHPFY
jgi:hypothetical protein